MQTENFFKKRKFFLLNIFLFTILVAVSFSSYYVYISDRFVPVTYIGNSNVSFLTKPDAYQKITDDISSRTNSVLKFQFQENSFTVDMPTANPNVNYSKALDKAFSVGHSGNFYGQFLEQIKSLAFAQKINPEISLNLAPQIEKIAKQIDQQPQDATIWLDGQNQIHIKESVNGISLEKEALKNDIANYLSFGTTPQILPVKNTAPSFSTLQAQNAKQALENVQKNPIKLKAGQNEWTIDVPTLFYLLKVGKTSPQEEETNFLLDSKKINSFLKDIALKTDKSVQEPLFKFDSNAKKVNTFQLGTPGEELDIEEANSLITKAVTGQIGSEINLPIKTIQPKIQNSEVNNLGINELIGKGVSNFAGSIENRIYNVKLTASRINGVLIPPGETFSFNKTVGEISGATGFKPAYVIKSGRTVLDDGGGVCQVSTTLFRAALNSGLPIVERTAHAYRVSYYEQGFPPGIDATIFHPTVDFKFKNDTPGHILIQAHSEGSTLYVDFYGTSDGRTVEMTKPVITDSTPPPPELRQDDPTLPRGQVKQVDWAAWGAKVSFKRTVTKNGEVTANETWRSNYKSWQAVYLVGTKD